MGETQGNRETVWEKTDYGVVTFVGGPLDEFEIPNEDPHLYEFAHFFQCGCLHYDDEFVAELHMSNGRPVAVRAIYRVEKFLSSDERRVYVIESDWSFVNLVKTAESVAHDLLPATA